jgi:predicted ester cyclase
MSDAESYRRIPHEIFTEGRLDLIDEIFSPDYVEHVVPPVPIPPGREGVRTFITAIREAFPDLNYSVVQQYQDGDTHIGLVRCSGTMRGDLAGMPASGRSATWDEVHIGRFSDGQLVEHWAVQDRLAMLQQLGFAPVPGA